jgi:hypothetical protein
MNSEATSIPQLTTIPGSLAEIKEKEMETKIITEYKIEGDLKFDGKIIFENDIEITGNLEAIEIEARGHINVRKKYIVSKIDICLKSQKVGKYQEVGEYQKVGEYCNFSFSVIDTEKIETNRIRFTLSCYHERNFWLAQLEQLKIEELSRAIENDSKCWDKIIEIAKKHKDKLLNYKYWIPAVKQAVEIMLSD